MSVYTTYVWWYQVGIYPCDYMIKRNEKEHKRFVIFCVVYKYNLPVMDQL